LQEMKGSIRVLCRIRPLLGHEVRGRKKEAVAIQFVNNHKVLVNNQGKNRE